MAQAVRILAVEDSATDAELNLRELRRAGYEPEWTCVETEEDFLRSLEATPDLILSDLTLPQFNGLRALELVRERQLDVPFILISGTMGEETAVAAMKHGATDYLLKDRLGRLGVAVNQALEQARLRKERREAEEALRESEERFRQLAENIQEVFWITAPTKDRLIYVSPAYEQIWGRPCSHVYESPRAWLAAIHKDDRDHVSHAAMTQQVDGTYNQEYRIVRPDGSVRWISDKAFPVRNEDGAVYRVVGVARDITEQKLAQEAVQASERRFAAFMDNLPALAWIKDAQGRHVYVNKMVRERGLQGRAWFGKTDEELWPSEIAAAYLANDRRVIETGEPLQTIESLAHGGEQRIALNSKFPIFDTAGELKFICGVGIDITEQRKTEEALAALRRQLELILQSVGEGIHGIDLDGTITFENPAAARLLGREVKDLLGQPAHETIHHSRADGTVYPQENCPMYQTLRDGVVRQRSDEAFWRKDGTSFPVEYLSAPMRDEAGNIAGAVVTFRDISERKAAERMSRREAQQYRALFQTHPNPTFVYEPESLTFLAVNEAASRNYGYSEEEFRTLRIPDLLLEDDLPVAHAAIEQDPTAAHYGIWRNRTKDGRVILVDIYSSSILFEDREARIAIAIDVTEQKKAEESIRQSEARLRALVESMDDIALEFDRDGTYVAIWTVREDLLSSPRAELVGRTIAEVHGEEVSKKFVDAFRRVMDVGEAEELDYSMQVMSGLREFHARVSPIIESNGSRHRVCILGRDVTEQKKLEAQFLRAQRVESIGTLASGVAHDLNNIIAPILMCSTVLREEMAPEERERAVDLIESCAERGAEIVRQVLTFARGTDGDRLLVQPSHLVKDMARIAAETFPKNITVEDLFSEGLWPIECDPTQLPRSRE